MIEESKGHCRKIMEVFGDWNVLLWPFPIYRLKEENIILENELARIRSERGKNEFCGALQILEITLTREALGAMLQGLQTPVLS